MIQGVQVIILNNNLELLIAKRSPFKKDGSERIGANRWNFIGGKLDENEKPIDAALRELKEEAGIALDHLFYLSEKENPWDPKYDPFYAYLYVGFIDEYTKIKLNPEHSEYKFIDIKDLDNYNFLGYTKDEIEDSLKSLMSQLNSSSRS